MLQVGHPHRAVVPIDDPNSPYYGQKGDDPASDPPGWYTQPRECAYGQDFINTHGFIGCVPHNSPRHTLEKGAIALGALATPMAGPISAELRGVELTGEGIGNLVRSQGDKIVTLAKELRTPQGAAKFVSDRAADHVKDVAKDRIRGAIRAIVRGAGIEKALEWAKHERR